MTWETYNFSDDFQNAILACLVRFPERFSRFGEIIKPEFFNGLSAVEVMYRLKDYVKKYGKYPNFSTLGNYVFVRTERKNPERAKELIDYVVMLANIDCGDVEAVFDLSHKFAEERAIFDALRKIHLHQQEGKKEKIDPVKILSDALMVGSDPVLCPTIKPALELLTSPPAVPPILIDGLLHQGSKLALGGSSKAFKSWSLMDLAISVATGGPWWNFNTIQSRVLYVNCEIHDWAFAQRMKALVEAKGIELNGGLDHICLRGFAADPENMLTRIEREIGQQKYGLMILDPIYKLLGEADENKAGDIAKIMNRLEAMLLRTESAVAFGAHFSKGNQSTKEAIDRISGSGVFARDPDSVLTMTAHEEENCYTVDAKVRNFAPVEPFVIRWGYPLFKTDKGLNPENLKPSPNNGKFKSKCSPQDVALLLAGRSLTNKEWMIQAMEQLGISEKTFYRKRSLIKNVVCEEGRFRIAEETVTVNPNK
jgi:hypothetical protein